VLGDCVVGHDTAYRAVEFVDGLQT
jgi:hypothetical protein